MRVIAPMSTNALLRRPSCAPKKVQTLPTYIKLNHPHVVSLLLRSIMDLLSMRPSCAPVLYLLNLYVERSCAPYHVLQTHDSETQHSIVEAYHCSGAHRFVEALSSAPNWTHLPILSSLPNIPVVDALISRSYSSTYLTRLPTLLTHTFYARLRTYQTKNLLSIVDAFMLQLSLSMRSYCAPVL